MELLALERPPRSTDQDADIGLGAQRQVADQLDQVLIAGGGIEGLAKFVIQPDGSVAGLQVVSTSGDIALDRPAYGSITGSNPFPPLPKGFTGPYLGLRFSYYYNMEVEGAGLR